MIYSGLVSITFRNLEPGAIIDLAAKARLDGIEWGGDIHVPPGRLDAAREIGDRTRDEGLKVAAYGSYYRVGSGTAGSGGFEDVLKTAAALKAPIIRVWAGSRASADTDEQLREAIVRESRTIARMAGDEGIAVAFEYHGNTLTDTGESAIRLLEDISHPNMGCYWQPPVFEDFDQRLSGLKGIMPWLRNIHVFCWLGSERLPLSEGREDWLKYLKAAAGAGGDRYAMLEFVKDDNPLQCLQDAEVLKQMLTLIHS